MLKRLMPARSAAEPVETQDLCDLDILQSRQVRFKLHGRWRAVEPITNRVFIAFWSAEKDYATGQHDAASYLKIIQAVCKDFTLQDVERMTLVQQANLITHIAGMIVGKNITEEIEKKNIAMTRPSLSSAS